MSRLTAEERRAAKGMISDALRKRIAEVRDQVAHERPAPAVIDWDAVDDGLLQRLLGAISPWSTIDTIEHTRFVLTSVMRAQGGQP